MAWSENGEMVKYVEYKNHLFAPEGEGCKPNMDVSLFIIGSSQLIQRLTRKLPIFELFFIRKW